MSIGFSALLLIISITLPKNVAGIPALGTLCPVNEVYTDCVVTCNDCITKGNCHQFVCHPGCDCIHGYYRDDTGECIPEEFCEVFCPENEVYSECKVPCDDCKNRGRCQFEVCHAGCSCIPSYFRNEYGACILEDHCPSPNIPKPTCKHNEEFHTCKPYCTGLCENYRSNRSCKEECRPGCFCKRGLFKNKQDICVRPEQCEVFCPEYEEYSECKIPCDNCKIRGRCQFEVCRAGCNCIPGYFRNEYGVCIPEDRCPNLPRPKCKPNEEFHDCKPYCTGLCENYRSNRSCKEVCRPGCFCKRGLLQNKQEICVRPEQCEEFCPENEEYSECKVPCDDCRIRGRCQFEVCRAGCNCIPGYFRNEYGACIPENRCLKPNPRTCGRNEVFYDCVPTCKHTCENIYRDESCLIEYCKPGCFCRQGLVKNNEGNCVEPNSCPRPQCGLNEEFSQCIIPCNDCKSRAACELFICKEGCDCKQGFFRNDSNICVPQTKCPTYNCGKNEVYTECVSPCNRCSERKDCPLFFECFEGCDCKTGFFKNEKDICVPESECDRVLRPPTCKPNEEFYNCKPYCTGLCENYRSKMSCKEECRPGCFCKGGLLKNKQDICVRLEQCEVPRPRCKPDEEFYRCTPYCKGTCESYRLNKPCNELCRPGCFCKKGLFRNKRRMCVPPQQCEPREIFCRPDEQYYECKPSCNNTCLNYFQRPFLCQANCVPGCFCRKGLIMNKDGKCVLPKDCKNSCRPDEKIYKCKPYCRNTCENFGMPNIQCPSQCKFGCFCKEGLVKRKDGKCVRPEECERPCKSNEQFYKCKPDCKNTCAKLNVENAECPNVCIPGCFCKVGLVKRLDGKCVKPAECPIPCIPGIRCFNPPLIIFGRSGDNSTSDNFTTETFTQTINDEQVDGSDLFARSGNSSDSFKKTPVTTMNNDVTTTTSAPHKSTITKPKIMNTKSTEASSTDIITEPLVTTELESTSTTIPSITPGITIKDWGRKLHQSGNIDNILKSSPVPNISSTIPKSLVTTTRESLVEKPCKAQNTVAFRSPEITKLDRKSKTVSSTTLDKIFARPSVTTLDVKPTTAVFTTLDIKPTTVSSTTLDKKTAPSVTTLDPKPISTVFTTLDTKPTTVMVTTLDVKPTTESVTLLDAHQTTTTLKTLDTKSTVTEFTFQDTNTTTLQPSTKPPTSQPLKKLSTRQPSRKPLTTQSSTKPPASPPSTKSSTKPPARQPSIKSSTKPSAGQTSTKSSTNQPSIMPPTNQHSTLPPISQPSIMPPANQPSTKSPTSQPSTKP